MNMSPNEFDAVASRVIDADRFIIRPPMQLRWQGPVNEEVFWEMYHGRALDRTMTRQKQSFRAWNMLVDGADEPLISIKFDCDAPMVHVTRAVLCHAHAVSSTGNV